MRWIYELSWLWKSIGIFILIVAICEWCVALIYKGMKKHYGVKAAICVAYEHTVIMEDKTVIPIKQISDIDGEMFGDMY